MSTPHDRLFKSTFSQPVHAIELFRSVLPPAVVQHIDFDTLRLEPESFIDEKLRARYSDLLFSVQLAGQHAYLYLLCEHQSRSERLMCVRVLRYVLDIWSAYLSEHPRARYVPLVLPVVVHHGEHGWKAPVRLRELYDAPEAVVDDLLAFLPDFRFFLDDLAPQSDDALRARALSALPRLVLWSFKNIRYGRDALPALRRAIDLVAAAVLAPNGVAATSVIMQYILEVTRGPEEDLHAFFIETARLPEAGEAIMTAAERLRREGHKQGRQEGLKEGRQEGLKEGEKKGLKEGYRQGLIIMLEARLGALPAAVLAAIRTADQTMLDRWYKQGSTARTLDDVFGDAT
jgi:predicted transposase/invertase (TIGR01784 family)